MNQPITNQLGKKILRRLVWTTGIVAIFIASLWAIAVFFEKDIEAYFLSKLNQELNTRVEIQEVSFSLLRNFPSASISLEQVSADHSKPFKGAGKLLTAEHIDFNFSIWNLLSGNYQVEKISVHNGSIQINRNADKEINYQLLKKKESASKNEKFSFTLNSVELHKMDLLIDDVPSKFKSSVRIDDCNFSGNFNELTYDLKVEGSLMANRISSNKQVYLQDRPVDLELDLQINQAEDKYLIRKSLVTISAMEISLAGIYKNLDNPYLDMEAEGEELDISSFLSLLPPGYDEKIKDYKSDGEMFAKCRIKGSFSEDKYPAVRVDFGLKNAEIENKKENVSLENVQLTGRYENNSGGFLNLNGVQFILNGGKFNGSAEIRNFNNPTFKFNVDAKLNLSDINRFVSTGVVSNLSGTADMKLLMNADVGSIKTFDQGGYDNIIANGYLKLSDAAFKIAGDTLNYKAFNGELRFENNLVRVEQLQGMLGKTDFKLKGSLNNLFAWLFGDKEPIGINAVVESRNVYLDELFERKSKASGSEEPYKFRISPRLSLNIRAKVNQLNFRKFNASAISGVFDVSGGQLSAQQLNFNTMKGSVQMNGKAISNSEGKLLLSCKAKLKKVDINRLFIEFENFGQAVVKDENIRGLVDADIDFEAIATSTLSIDPSLVYSKVDLIINQGQLIRFEPLKALSKFISLNELMDVKFSQLKNTIEIRNSKIIIPQMDIASNAISISASGVHSFDNIVEYHLRLLLSDILARKAKKARKDVEEFGVVEDDGLGRTSLFISMKGPVSDPIISYDSQGARAKIKNDLVKEKQTMKQLLKEEFGLFKKDTSIVKPTKDQKKQSKVIISFDEDEE
jgi:hypothetical protein